MLLYAIQNASINLLDILEVFRTAIILEKDDIFEVSDKFLD
jgi:hypothetical protein